MTLEIYPVALQLVRRLSPYLPALRARSASLGDQLERALISVPLNIAEGAYSRGKTAMLAINLRQLRRGRRWLASRPRKLSAGFSRSSRSSWRCSTALSAPWCGSSIPNANTQPAPVQVRLPGHFRRGPRLDPSAAGLDDGGAVLFRQTFFQIRS